MSIENNPNDISKMMCCASIVRLTIYLMVCVTVTKNISVNTHAFHSKENQKRKGPEVLHSEEISELVFSGMKTHEKKAETAWSPEMLLTENASCHIPKHCTLNTYRNSDKEETYFVSEFILTQIIWLNGKGGGGRGEVAFPSFLMGTRDHELLDLTILTC